MFRTFIFLSVFVFSVLAFEQNLNERQKISESEIPLKIIDVEKRSVFESFDELSETTTTEEPKEVSTEVPTPVSEEVPKDVPKDVSLFNEVPKEETEPKKEEAAKEEAPKEEAPKEEVPKVESTEENPIVSDVSPQKEDLNIKKEGERIEREDEEEKASVPSQPPKEVEEMTPSSPSPVLPSVTPPSTPFPSRPTLPPVKPTVTLASVPANRPAYPPLQPEQPVYPSNVYPNYWQNPNWGNWGRFVPQTVPDWAQNWPSFGVSVPSVPTITSVASIPSYPSYNPSNLIPARYSPFSMTPSSGVPTFSFLVTRNQYPSGGRGYQIPGSRPSVPNYQPGFQPGYQPNYQPSYQPDYQPSYQPGYQPSYQPPYQPRYLPPGGPTQGLFPGIGGYYPSVEGNRPSVGGFYPGRGQSPRFYPEDEQPSQPQPQPQPRPQPQPGADPNQPYGPMGPEMNNPDATMIDPNLMRGNDAPQG